MVHCAYRGPRYRALPPPEAPPAMLTNDLAAIAGTLHEIPFPRKFAVDADHDEVDAALEERRGDRLGQEESVGVDVERLEPDPLAVAQHAAEEVVLEQGLATEGKPAFGTGGEGGDLVGEAAPEVHGHDALGTAHLGVMTHGAAEVAVGADLDGKLPGERDLVEGAGDGSKVVGEHGWRRLGGGSARYLGPRYAQCTMPLRRA